MLARVIKDVRGSQIELTPISALLDRLTAAWHPTAVWLFGSRARGEATPTSDWDLLIVVPDEVSEVDDPLAAWRLKKDFNVPSDLFPCRASEFAEDRNTPNTIAYEAAHGGVLIYER